MASIDGTNVRQLTTDAPPQLRWHPSGRAIVVVAGEDGVDNLWELPLDGSARRQLTRFEQDGMFRFDVDRDGRYALCRGRMLRDVVLGRIAP